MNKLHFVPFLAFIAMFFTCGSQHPTAPISFVDSYHPQLLEPVGTVYSEDYFPLKPGLTWTDSGTTQVTLTMHMTVNSPQPETHDTTETISMDVVTVKNVEPQQEISIAGMNHTVIPIKTVSTGTTGSDSSSSFEQTSFYEVTDTAILLIANVVLSDTGYDTMTVTNGTVLKKPLVVGSQWESTPTFAFNSSAGSYIKDMKIHSVTHVIGKKNITSNGRSIRALRLDQVSEMSCSLEGDSLTGNERMLSTSVQYLVKDTGMVKQELQQNMTMDLSMILFGTSITEVETIQSTSSQDLISFTMGNPALKKNAMTAGHPVLFPFRQDRVAGLKSLTRAQRRALLRVLCLKKALFLQ